MAENDNPAGRLFNLLTDIAAVGNNPKVRLETRLTDLLDVPAGNHAELLRRMAPIYDLPAQIRSEVARLPISGTSFTVKLGVIEEALLALNIGLAVQQWSQRLAPDAMHELTICSDMLHQYVPEKTGSDEQLAQIRADLDATLEDVRSSTDLPADLRTFLLDHLHEMTRALDLYKVVGLDALRQSFERAIGGIVTRPDLITDENKSRPVWGKFGKLLAGLGLVFATANQGTELVQNWFPDALPAASAVAPSDDDVVDAEIVGDDNTINVTVESPEPAP